MGRLYTIEEVSNLLPVQSKTDFTNYEKNLTKYQVKKLQNEMPKAIAQVEDMHFREYLHSVYQTHYHIQKEITSEIFNIVEFYIENNKPNVYITFSEKPNSLTPLTGKILGFKILNNQIVNSALGKVLLPSIVVEYKKGKRSITQNMLNQNYYVFHRHNVKYELSLSTNGNIDEFVDNSSRRIKFQFKDKFDRIINKNDYVLFAEIKQANIIFGQVEDVSERQLFIKSLDDISIDTDYL